MKLFGVVSALGCCLSVGGQKKFNLRGSLDGVRALTGRTLQSCGESCDNNGASSWKGACENSGVCNLNAQKCIYCTGCIPGYTGDRCEISPLGGSGGGGGQTCSDGGASSDLGACQNGSTCNLNNAGWIWCACPAGFSGARCEVGPSGGGGGASTPQSCDNNGASSDLGACQNGSTCKLNGAGYIYCDNCVGYTGLRCSTPTGTGDGGGTGTGDAGGVICTAPNVPCGHAQGPNGLTPDTKCCTNGQLCYADPNGTDYSTTCLTPVASCPAGTTECGGTYDSSSGGVTPGNDCCDSATELCVSDQTHGGKVCRPKFAGCPANQVPCGHYSGGYGSVGDDDRCCNAPCPAGVAACNQCVNFSSAGGTTTSCAYSFPCTSTLCQNGGTCSETQTQQNGAVFDKCICPAGYSGTYCEV